MLVGLVAAGFYSCFYGSGRGAVWTGIGTAGLLLGAFWFPEMRFAVPVLTAFWMMLGGILWAEQPDCQGLDKAEDGLYLDGRSSNRHTIHRQKSGFRLGIRRKGGQGRHLWADLRIEQWEQLFLAGGVWLMVYSLAEFGSGNVLLPIEPLQTALILAILVTWASYLLGRGKSYPLWTAALAVLWLLAGFLGSIVYAEPWQNRVMTVLLYLAVSGVLAFQQIYCIRQELERAVWKERPEARGYSAPESGWRESALQEYRQLQIFEHDFRHHLDIVAALYEEGSRLEARAYMEDLKQARESRQGQKEGGERELAYIMMAKRQACRQAEISFSYQIVGSPRGIAQMDMTALLLNLLDNAIRACEEVPKPRSIGVMLLSRGELWEIEIINSGRYETEESLNERTGEGRTAAGTEQGMERKVHGIGLVSVRQIVEKYQGIYRMWQEEGQVRQKLILVQRGSSSK